MEDWISWAIWLGIVGIIIGVYFYVDRANPPAQPADGASLNGQLSTYPSFGRSLGALLDYFTTLNQGFNLVPVANSSDYTLYSKDHITSAAVINYYRIDPAGIAAVRNQWPYNNSYPTYSFNLSGQSINVEFNIGSARTKIIRNVQILILK